MENSENQQESKNLENRLDSWMKIEASIVPGQMQMV